ncbi:hypothetical protein AZ34_11935 [Hylemonella gracilis str. Niagara R]|uniref:Uncharacterized protein n=2 Tax=Hylemonella gracilis TaxID=80880 RepID=A0A016XNU6_9BURK|nr:hypothetical protein AZ34_11935 [Hylemonella gracilis str. Niagara R]
MDKRAKVDWAWLPAAMPQVAGLMREKRKLYGDAHVNECWRRGVIQGEAGWFFAREGALTVGTPLPGPNGNSLFEQFSDLGPAMLQIAPRPGHVEEVVDGVVVLVPVDGVVNGAH